jgi:hypothetical protein
MYDELKTRYVIDRFVFIFYIFFGFSFFLMALKADGYRWANEMYFSSIFLFLIYIYSKLKLIKEQKNWISVQATILSKKIIKNECLGLLMVDSFYPEIEYTYSYNNQSYTSERYALFDCNQLMSYKYVQGLLSRYRTGQIEVFINPSQLSQSVIHKGLSTRYQYLIYGMIFYAFFVLLIGILL